MSVLRNIKVFRVTSVTTAFVLMIVLTMAASCAPQDEPTQTSGEVTQDDSAEEVSSGTQSPISNLPRGLNIETAAAEAAFLARADAVTALKAEYAGAPEGAIGRGARSEAVYLAGKISNNEAAQFLEEVALTEELILPEEAPAHGSGTGDESFGVRYTRRPWRQEYGSRRAREDVGSGSRSGRSLPWAHPRGRGNRNLEDGGT